METEDKKNNEIEIQDAGNPSGTAWATICGLMTVVANVLMVLFTISAIPMMKNIGMPWYVTIGMSLLWGVWPYVGLYWLVYFGFLDAPIFSAFMTNVFSTYLTVSILKSVTNVIMNCYFETPTWEYRLNQALKLLGRGVSGDTPKTSS